MAQTGFTLSDEGRTITVLNDSGTTAIFAGDICHVGTVDNVLTGTAASARNAYGAGDIKVFSMKASATGYKTVVGVAVEDIGTAAYGSIALEGVFIHAVQTNTEAGELLRGSTAAGKLVPLVIGTTAYLKATFDNQLWSIGKALTGGSADGKYIIWKLSL